MEIYTQDIPNVAVGNGMVESRCYAVCMFMNFLSINIDAIINEDIRKNCRMTPDVSWHNLKVEIKETEKLVKRPEGCLFDNYMAYIDAIYYMIININDDDSIEFKANTCMMAKRLWKKAYADLCMRFPLIKQYTKIID